MDEAYLSKAGLTDIPQLVSYIKTYHLLDDLPFERDKIEKSVSEILENSHLGKIYLIKIANKSIGYAVLCFGYSIEFYGRDAFLDELFIEQKYRGKGIGKRVLTLLLREARAMGIRAVHLEVNRKNKKVQALYESVGFQPRKQFLFMSTGHNTLVDTR